jgi:outer membrane protein assembly factor BamE (lipoprotein component of BamABCDE complex)
MSRIGRVVAIALPLLLTGCMAAGVQVKAEQLQGFKKGETTKQDVLSKLGNPTARSITADGSEILIYNYAAYQARPESFIPLIGPLVGGADVQTSMVWFQFGSDGKLTNYTAQNSAVGSGSNLAAPSTPRTPAQPSNATP